ncbi:hypothetical protein CYMTET_24062 [Cymbomonas tetramitiformis]|uniref:Uncharacterized protein n=1 Tax=Cymbomonas tetramitiformis TaxID=36881 RepID=A0AAE0FXH1_9CHLO|nr:hypothetical protein CYMTET_24062 [Cymbomonas tetramitiformis]
MQFVMKMSEDAARILSHCSPIRAERAETEVSANFSPLFRAWLCYHGLLLQLLHLLLLHLSTLLSHHPHLLLNDYVMSGRRQKI